MSARSSTRTDARAARGGAAVLACCAAFAVAGAGCSKKASASAPEPVKVAAAADLAFAFKEVGADFEKASGRSVVFSFGSTGLLEKQIAEGAPFDVFAAANVSFADDAVSAGACQGDTKALYATGRIVLYPAPGAAFAPKTVADLADPRIKKIAIANPEHAPYGRAAQQAMERGGVWDRVQAQGKVVYGENVQQTLQFAQSGNADVAIVAMSLALADHGAGSVAGAATGDAAGGAPARSWVEVPAELHDRIDQALVVCKNGKAGFDAGKAFVAYVQSPAARVVMRRYGFLLPGESLAAGTP